MCSTIRYECFSFTDYVDKRLCAATHGRRQCKQCTLLKRVALEFCDQDYGFLNRHIMQKWSTKGCKFSNIAEKVDLTGKISNSNHWFYIKKISNDQQFSKLCPNYSLYKQRNRSLDSLLHKKNNYQHLLHKFSLYILYWCHYLYLLSGIFE